MSSLDKYSRWVDSKGKKWIVPNGKIHGTRRRETICHIEDLNYCVDIDCDGLVWGDDTILGTMDELIDDVLHEFLEGKVRSGKMDTVKAIPCRYWTDRNGRRWNVPGGMISGDKTSPTKGDCHCIDDESCKTCDRFDCSTCVACSDNGVVKEYLGQDASISVKDIKMILDHQMNWLDLVIGLTETEDVSVKEILDRRASRDMKEDTTPYFVEYLKLKGVNVV